MKEIIVRLAEQERATIADPDLIAVIRRWLVASGAGEQAWDSGGPGEQVSAGPSRG